MKRARILLTICAVIFLLVAANCVGQAAPLTRTEFVLWTTCTVTLYDHAKQDALDAVFDRLHELHSRLSVNIPGSELDAVSAAAGRKAVHVSDDLFHVLKEALRYSALSDGLFDPTVGTLMKAWKMNTDQGHIPAPADISQALSLVNWHDVVLDESAKTVYVKRAGMSLDVGGVLKGYAADETALILAARGVKSAMIDLGGNILAMGPKADGSPWRIGLQDPDSTRGTSFGTVEVVDKSVVTSGVYEHYFVQNGKRYHHIMDTHTGYPVENGLAAVTVVARTSIIADGWDTTLLCMGPARGLAIAKSLGLDAVLVGRDHKLYATDDMKKMLTITDPSFTYAAP